MRSSATSSSNVPLRTSPMQASTGPAVSRHCSMNTMALIWSSTVAGHPRACTAATSVSQVGSVSFSPVGA
ncbi:Uncharacterised protein [Bordetella pertussis]|nr:hypothetical protein [Bordetella pertussis]CPK15694.1 Uncharacterised protein [Bordetella pertussis]